MEHRCEICNTEFYNAWKRAKYCSRECRRKRNLLISGRSTVNKLDIPTGTIGAIAELAVSQELLSMGYYVFRALSQSCYCDLIAVKNLVTHHIEVRTGYKNSVNNKLSFPRHYREGTTCFAVWERNSGKIFYLDLNLKELNLSL